MQKILAVLTRTRDSRWLAEFPDLPGCEAAAASLAQLRELARGAAIAALRERRTRGEPTPDFADWDKIASHPLARCAMVLRLELP